MKNPTAFSGKKLVGNELLNAISEVKNESQMYVLLYCGYTVETSFKKLKKYSLEDFYSEYIKALHEKSPEEFGSVKRTKLSVEKIKDIYQDFKNDSLSYEYKFIPSKFKGTFNLHRKLSGRFVDFCICNGYTAIQKGKGVLLDNYLLNDLKLASLDQKDLNKLRNDLSTKKRLFRESKIKLKGHDLLERIYEINGSLDVNDYKGNIRNLVIELVDFRRERTLTLTEVYSLIF